MKMKIFEQKEFEPEFDVFSAEKFGTDNATCEQDSTTASGKKMTIEQLLDLQEKTLAKQREGNEAVMDEDESPHSADDDTYGGGLGDDTFDGDTDEAKLERDKENWGEDEEGLPNIGTYGGGLSDEEESNDERERRERSGRSSFEEQLDYRWFNDEYVMLDEAVDFAAIEADPKQLFTIGNSKVGQDTIIFNLQPARFCPSFEKGMCKIVAPVDGQFKIACYAYQDERQYKTALQLRIRQMRFWDTHTAEEIYDKLADFYELSRGSSMTFATLKAKNAEKKKTPFFAGKPATPEVKAKTKSIKLKYIRFNQSGDIKDAADAEKMDEVARLAKENLQLVSYTYTARRDILKEYKFQHVHVQGSGFSAITAINRPIHGKRGGEFSGKVFTAFPSIFNKSHKPQERIPGKLYYEDIFEKKTADGKDNSLYDKYSKSNPSGWYACPGDCNSCPACKTDKFKHIGVKIHRSFQKISQDWHDVEKTDRGYEVKQKFDVYQRDEKGKPVDWTQEMEQEYEDRAMTIQKEQDFNRLPKEEQVEIATNKLKELYGLLDPDLDEDALDTLKKDINRWQIKAARRGIDWKKIKQEAR